MPDWELYQGDHTKKLMFEDGMACWLSGLLSENPLQVTKQLCTKEFAYSSEGDIIFLPKDWTGRNFQHFKCTACHYTRHL